MLREDYLLRLIEQIGKVIARLRELLLKGEAVPERELNQAAAAAGYDLGLLRILTSDSVSLLVNPTGNADALRSVLVAELLFADALVARARDDGVGIEDRLQKASALLAAAEQDVDAVRRSLVVERITALREQMGQTGPARPD